MKIKGGKKYKGIDDTVRQQRREERKEVYLEKRELKRILLGRSCKYQACIIGIFNITKTLMGLLFSSPGKEKT